MKKIKARAYSTLLVALCLLAGVLVYICRYAVHGRDWVAFPANQAVYQDGRLTAGVLTDRGGLVLADVADGARRYAADAATRVACLHLLGDRAGNIGTGALLQFADRLTGYSAVTGLPAGGATLRLSVDAPLCVTAQEALAGRRGAVLLMDYTNGEILCMTSSPSYDPDLGFDPGDGRYEGVFINRCISAAYTPGSVFKLVTMAAAIETLPDLYERSFSCTGSTLADGNQINCTGVHGQQTIEQALANSCNCAFAALSLELGGETLARYAADLGFTEALDLDGIPTAAGSFDAADAGSAALAWSGIGQSTDLVCPYALLRYVAAIGNGGVLAQPTLFAGGGGKETRLLSPDTAQALKSMMNYNVVYGYGEGSFPGLTLCAKSGTAEVGDGSSHAWFTGFLDDPEHPYAFVVVIENGGGGLRSAGPVANAVLQAAVNTTDGAN